MPIPQRFIEISLWWRSLPRAQRPKILSPIEPLHLPTKGDSLGMKEKKKCLQCAPTQEDPFTCIIMAAPAVSSHSAMKSSHLASLTPDWMNNEVLTGTSIMAVEFDGGVVVGADSRTSMGVYVSNRVTDKLTRVTDHIYCCRSGSAADTQAIADIVSSHMELLEVKLGDPPLVQIAANTFKEICYNYRDQLMAGIIVAGWDKAKGGQVYTIPLGGMIVRQPVAIGGSGSTYVWGHIDAAYRPNMTKEETVDFVKNTLTLALTRDGSSGGVVRVAIITKDGAERRVFLHNDLPQFYQG